MNPILSREIRSRFRDKRSFWLLLSLAVLLCLGAGWIYQEALHRSELMDQYLASGGAGNPFSFSVDRASQTGRELFKSLAYGNVLVWMFVAPALTATGLCKERERGLLESLWLSPFKVSSQIMGRFLASLFFLFELQLVALPVYGIALMLGGVSPQEILSAGAIIAMTAFGGAALGLWCSARAYRPSNAMGSALGIVIFGTVVAFFGVQFLGSIFSFLSWSTLAIMTGYVGMTHPLYMLAACIEEGNMGRSFMGYVPDDLLPYSLGAQLLVSVLLLFLATRKAAKPLPESASLGRHPYLERYRRGLDERKKARAEKAERARVGEKVGGALLYEVPFEKMVKFRDPVLRREVRAKFRMRQSGAAIAILRLAMLFLVAVTWLFMITSLFYGESREPIGMALTNVLAVLGIITIGAMSSSTLTNERESGTWEGLKLSLLSTESVVFSKWVAPLVTFGFWSSPLWIWLPFCIRFSPRIGIPFFSLVGAISIGVVAFAATAAWGLYVSSRSPHTAAATSWTVATLILFLVGGPIMGEMLDVKPKIVRLFYGDIPQPRYYYRGYYGSDEMWANGRFLYQLLDSYHPIIALNTVIEEPRGYEYEIGGDIDGSGMQNDLKFWTWFLSVGEGVAVTILLLNLTKKRLKKIET